MAGDGKGAVYALRVEGTDIDDALELLAEDDGLPSTSTWAGLTWQGVVDLADRVSSTFDGLGVSTPENRIVVWETVADGSYSRGILFEGDPADIPKESSGVYLRIESGSVFVNGPAPSGDSGEAITSHAAALKDWWPIPGDAAPASPGVEVRQTYAGPIVTVAGEGVSAKTEAAAAHVGVDLGGYSVPREVGRPPVAPEVVGFVTQIPGLRGPLNREALRQRLVLALRGQVDAPDAVADAIVTLLGTNILVP